MADHRRVVIGVGNEYRRDDGVGPRVVAELIGRLPDVELRITDGEPSRMLDLWTGAALAVVVDAVHAPDRPVGAWFELAASDAPDEPSAGTHGVGLGTAVALGRVLGRAAAVPRQEAQQPPSEAAQHDLARGDGEILSLRAVDFAGQQHHVVVGDRADQRRPEVARRVLDQQAIRRAAEPGTVTPLHRPDHRPGQAEAEPGNLAQRGVQETHPSTLAQLVPLKQTVPPENGEETTRFSGWGFPYPRSSLGR